MGLSRLWVWMVVIGVLLTSVMCSILPVPSQLAPTIEPIQETVSARLTALSYPTSTITSTQTPRPTTTAIPTSTPEPSTPTPVKPGAISGNISYITQYPPPLRVVAFKVGENIWYSVETAQNAKTYTIENVSPGRYLVIAYLLNPGNTDPTFGGGYTRAVLCGLTAKCTNHALIEVEVKPGETTRNVHPADWSAPRGAFPKNPSLP